MNWLKKLASLAMPVPKESATNIFTLRAQQALGLAYREAARLNHNFVGTEHLLLGLVGLGPGTAVRALSRMGISPETVRAEVEKCVAKGSDETAVGRIPYTPRVKKVLALATKEAKWLNHTHVGTEHILLGILHEGGGVAAMVLKKLNIDIEQTRSEILKVLDTNPPAGDKENPVQG
jgi:ATP-dependent Clp protease ATP-binding subunit ClpC